MLRAPGAWPAANSSGSRTSRSSGAGAHGVVGVECVELTVHGGHLALDARVAASMPTQYRPRAVAPRLRSIGDDDPRGARAHDLRRRPPHEARRRRGRLRPRRARAGRVRRLAHPRRGEHPARHALRRGSPMSRRTARSSRCAPSARGRRRRSRCSRAPGVGAEVLSGGMAAWSNVFDDAELEVDGATVVQVRRRGKGCLSYLVAAARPRDRHRSRRRRRPVRRVAPRVAGLDDHPRRSTRTCTPTT